MVADAEPPDPSEPPDPPEPSETRGGSAPVDAGSSLGSDAPLEPVAPVAPADAGLRTRPPRGPLRFIGAVALLTVPLAVAAVAMGDGVLGMVALVSAVWAASLTFIGWTAYAWADRDGVQVHWMRATERVDWVEVTAVEVDRSGPGGARRGAVLVLTGDRRLRWTPWVPFLWFAHAGANRSVDELDALLVVRGLGLRVTDPRGPGRGDRGPDPGTRN